MRKLVQALLITLGCFSAAAVYANEEVEVATTKEVVTTTESGTDKEDKDSKFRLFQQGEETAEGSETVKTEESKA